MIAISLAALLWGLPMAPVEDSYELWLQQGDASAPYQQLIVSGAQSQRLLALALASRLASPSREGQYWQQLQWLLAAEGTTWPKWRAQLALQFQQEQRWLNSGAGQSLNADQRRQWQLMEWVVNELMLLRYDGPNEQPPRLEVPAKGAPRYQPKWGGS